MKNEKQIEEMLKAGTSVTATAKHFHVSKITVASIRDNAGIRNVKPSYSFSSDVLDSAVSDINEDKKTITEVAETLKCNRVTLARLLKGKLTRSYRPQNPKWTVDYELTQVQKEVLIGDMFGDGCLVGTSEGRAYYQCAHCMKQKEFVNFKRSVFAPLSSKGREYVTKDGEYITMGTWTCNAFGKFRKTFYPRGKGLKAMPVSLVDEMTPLSLAVWYMGDGSLNRNTGVFTLGKQITNAQEIVDKLNLLFGCSFVLKDYGRYYQIRTMNCSKFFSLISPYILTSFGYKIPKSYQNLVGNQQPSLERNLLEGSETRQKAKDQKSMPINAACGLNTAETAGTWDTLSK